MNVNRYLYKPKIKCRLPGIDRPSEIDQKIITNIAREIEKHAAVSINSGKQRIIVMISQPLIPGYYRTTKTQLDLDLSMLMRYLDNQFHTIGFGAVIRDKPAEMLIELDHDYDRASEDVAVLFSGMLHKIEYLNDGWLLTFTGRIKFDADVVELAKKVDVDPSIKWWGDPYFSNILEYNLDFMTGYYGDEETPVTIGN